MTQTCTAYRCHEDAAGHGTLCERHRKTARRHGHPLQEAISTARLTPYKKLVGARREKNRDNPLWGILAERWEAVQRTARDICQQYESGSPVIGHELQAAQQVCTVGSAVGPGAVVDTVLALYLMQELEPRAFRDDRAFRFQVVRRFNGLTDRSAGAYWDNKEQRTKLVYRDMPPRAVEVLAGWLTQAFGQAGLILAHKEQAERQAAQEDAQKLTRALEAIQ